MRRHLPVVLCLCAAAACKVTDAPDSLEEIAVFGFVHLAEPAEIQAVADELPLLVKRNRADLEDGYRVDSLRRADLVEAGVDVGEVKAIVGAMGRVEYSHDLPDVLDAISHKHKDQVAENTTEYAVLEDTDRGCFLRQECDSYSVTARQVTKQPLLGNLTQTFSQDFVWVEHEGRDAVASRVIAPEPVEVSSGLAAVDQQYAFFLVRQLPGGGTERTESMWADARLLGADLPDSFLVDSAVNAMGTQAEKVDAWLDSR